MVIYIFIYLVNVFLAAWTHVGHFWTLWIFRVRSTPAWGYNDHQRAPKSLGMFKIFMCIYIIIMPLLSIHKHYINIRCW